MCLCVGYVAAYLGGTNSNGWKIYNKNSAQCLDHGLPDLPTTGPGFVEFGFAMDSNSVVYLTGGSIPWGGAVDGVRN